MIVISNDVVLTADEAIEGVDNNNPRVGWHTILTEANLAATSEADGFPVTNLARPATHLRWRSEEATEPETLYVTITLDEAASVNYYGLAAHNLGTLGATVQLQSSTLGVTWVDVTDERLLTTDHAYMEEFETANGVYFRLKIEIQGGAVELAVLNIGRVLRMQRRLYVGFKPPTLNRDTTVSSGYSENGQFLGRVIRSQALSSDAPFENLTPSWYRGVFEEFAEVAPTTPFFFAWRPGDYPAEVGYMWLQRDLAPTNQRSNGMMNVTMSMQGIR